MAISDARSLNHLSPAERTAVAVSLLAFTAAFAAYVGDYPVLKSLISPDSAKRAVVGRIESLEGTIRRQSLGMPGFREIPLGDSVLDKDAIATDASSTGRIMLDEGGVIELGPSSLVRLDFESKFSLSGISRTLKVEAIRGTVSGEAGARPIEIRGRRGVVRIEPTRKKRVVARTAEMVEVAADVPMPKPAAPAPAPIETPVAAVPVVEAPPASIPSVVPSILPAAPPPAEPASIALIEPSPGALAVLDLQTIGQGAQVRFAWKWSGARNEKSLARLTVRAVGANQPVLQRDLPASTESFQWWAPAPGKYSWDVIALKAPGRKSKPAAARLIRVPAQIAGLELKPLKYDLSKPADPVAVLTWMPVSKAASYRVIVEDSLAAGKTIWTRDRIREPMLRINMSSVPSERWRYRAVAEMPGGFQVTSSEASVAFATLPIALGEPAKNARITEAELRQWEGRVLFTWQRALGASGYRLEVSRDEGFKKDLIDERIQKNFASYELDTGKYWWRVTPLGSTERKPGAPQRFDVGDDK